MMTFISKNWAIDDGFVYFSQLLSYYGDGFGQIVERNLGEKMMFGLELHSSHQDYPEWIAFSIVSARYYLMVDEGGFDFLWISFFPFVISDQNIGGEKPRKEFSKEEVNDVPPAIDEKGIVQQNHRGVQLDISRNVPYFWKKWQ